MKESKEERQARQEIKAYERKEAVAAKEHKVNVRRELKLLKFMLKTDVLNHHHGRSESMRDAIEKQIAYLKTRDKHTEYDPYYWNYSEGGTSQMPLCFLGCLPSISGFDSIYDVPLDGSYVFYIYDSGQRGLGSYNRIACKLAAIEVSIPKVNPGALIPITTT